MARIDVVVVAYNSRDELAACVGELSRAPGIEVFVVDNASPDRSLEAVAGLPVNQLPQAENRGFAVGCNIGWRAGSSRFVVFLNPDAQISPADLGRLADVLERDPAAGAAAPKIVDGEGRLEPSLRRFPRARSTFAQALFLHRLFPEAPWVDEVVREETAYAAPHAVEWASGACLLVRRDVLERLGGMDERFFMYCEDTDLCRRIADLGLQVRYEPGAVTRHLGGRSAPRGRMIPVLAASRVNYARKHAGPLGALAERLGVALGGATHALLGRGGSSVRAGHLRSMARAATPVPDGRP